MTPFFPRSLLYKSHITSIFNVTPIISSHPSRDSEVTQAPSVHPPVHPTMSSLLRVLRPFKVAARFPVSCRTPGPASNLPLLAQRSMSTNDQPPTDPETSSVPPGEALASTLTSFIDSVSAKHNYSKYLSLSTLLLLINMVIQLRTMNRQASPTAVIVFVFFFCVHVHTFARTISLTPSPEK